MDVCEAAKSVACSDANRFMKIKRADKEDVDSSNTVLSLHQSLL